MKNLLPEANFATPLDELLRSGQGCQARTWQDQATSHSPKPLQAYPIKSSEIFLHPSSLPNGEKILWIVDFVDSIIPRDDEHLLSSVGQTKIIGWSKTIQFCERVVHIPLPLIPYSPICPVTACSRAFRFTYQSSGSSQAINWLHPTTLSVQTFTYHSFSTKLRGLIAELGLHAGDYTSHSFRRRGAFFAYQAGVPIELIKVLGDWKSNAILLYLTIPLTIHLQSVNILFKHILSLFQPTTR